MSEIKRGNGTKSSHRTAVIIVAAVLFLVLLVWGVKNWKWPRETQEVLEGTGCLFLDGEDQTPLLLPVSVTWKKKHYVFHNEDDSIETVSLKVDGQELLAEDDFFPRFLSYFPDGTAEVPMTIGNSMEEGRDLLELFSTPYDGSRFVFGFGSLADFPSESLSGITDQTERRGLLVVPADSPEAAKERIGEIVYRDAVDEWLEENGIQM